MKKEKKVKTNKKQKEYKKKKMTIPIILLVIVVSILILLTVILIKNSSYNQEEFAIDLTSMGNEVYSEYYYKIMEIEHKDKLEEYLKSYETIGFKFDLLQLSNYSDEFKNKVDKFIRHNKKCDKEGTMVIIYPISPYGSTDFKSEIKIDCQK